MFPEGYAYIGKVCTRCDDPVISAYIAGLKLQLETVSVPFVDARVLCKYWDIVVNIWPDWYTEHGQAGTSDMPIKFYAAQWANDTPPSKGRLYIRHLCRVRRRPSGFKRSEN